MNRCSVCVMPDTRPDVPFIDGVCAACVTYQSRPTVDWEARKRMLVDLLDRFHGECIVPSSGGKDSTYQVMTLLGMGAHVTVVTATTCHLTEIGRKNIDNLARHARTIEYSPNKTVRAKLNRLGLELVGDISWPEHSAIFTTPFKASHQLGIPLIFYGENPQNQYGGPQGSEEAMQMTRRWRSEFGGFLGLRPDDVVGKLGITDRDMDDYRLTHKDGGGQEAHFLGQYLPWDSHENARVAMEAGMQAKLPCPENWWHWENLDNAQTGLHDYFGYLKYGYGRGCAQISADVRTGRVDRSYALQWARKNNGAFPPSKYAGVRWEDAVSRIGLTTEQCGALMDRFTNWDLFVAGKFGPVLKATDAG